jgi:hypothetical protein
MDGWMGGRRHVDLGGHRLGGGGSVGRRDWQDVQEINRDGQRRHLRHDGG